MSRCTETASYSHYKCLPLKIFWRALLSLHKAAIFRGLKNLQYANLEHFFPRPYIYDVITFQRKVLFFASANFISTETNVRQRQRVRTLLSTDCANLLRSLVFLFTKNKNLSLTSSYFFQCPEQLLLKTYNSEFIAPRGNKGSIFLKRPRSPR